MYILIAYYASLGFFHLYWFFGFFQFFFSRKKELNSNVMVQTKLTKITHYFPSLCLSVCVCVCVILLSIKTKREFD